MPADLAAQDGAVRLRVRNVRPGRNRERHEKDGVPDQLHILERNPCATSDRERHGKDSVPDRFHTLDRTWAAISSGTDRAKPDHRVPVPRAVTPVGRSRR